MPEIETIEGCYMPHAQENQTLISIGAYEGDALSNVTASGPESVTHTIEVEISPTVSNAFIVLSSYRAVVWEVVGNTDAIGAIVLSSHVSNSDGYTGSGIIGIDAGKVSYLPRNCIGYHYESGPKREAQFISRIAALTGKAPDFVFGDYSFRRVVVGPEEATFEDSEPSLDASAGFSSEVWPRLTRFNPGGIASFDPKDVVSHSAAEIYNVLPIEAGLAKLVFDEILEEVSLKEGRNTYRLTSSIPYFPAGLSGSHAVSFIIPQGISLPKGNSGHSCVFREGTGEILGGSSRRCIYPQ